MGNSRTEERSILEKVNISSDIFLVRMMTFCPEDEILCPTKMNILGCKDQATCFTKEVGTERYKRNTKQL